MNLLEGELRIVGVLEPVEAPLAAGLERGRKGVALAAGADTAVLGAGETAKLPFATVKQADASAGHVEVEMVGAKITTSTGRLDDQGLARNRTRSECEAGINNRQ